MRSIFRATALLGGASVINILIGLISSKVTAVLLGPNGFGLMALYQSIVTLVVMIAGLGIPTALTRGMAGALAGGRASEALALRRAGWMVTIGAGLIATVLVVAFSRLITEMMLDGRGDTGWALFVAPTIMFSMMASIQIAVINARQRVADLARISVLSAAVSLIPTIALTWIFRSRGVAPALAASVLINLAIGYYHYRRSERTATAGGLHSPLPDAMRQLVGFGLPYMASVAVGAGVLALLPVLVLHALGPTEVGLFRASSALAVTYLGVILTSLSQDYFPRIAAAPDDREVLGGILNDQLRLILLLSGPVILAMIGIVPYLIPLLYSGRFAPAADILAWQLIGDLFKFATWAMGFVIMARLSSRTFFLTELVCGSVLLASSWYGMMLAGLPGLGMAFLATGVIACGINWLVLYRSTGITWRSDNIILFCLLAVAMASLRMVASAEIAWLNLLGAAVLTIAFGSYSLTAIMREYGGWRVVLGRRRRAAHG